MNVWYLPTLSAGLLYNILPLLPMFCLIVVGGQPHACMVHAEYERGALIHLCAG